MRRIGLLPALWLAACGSPAAPSDMLGGNGDQAMAPSADQSLLADLSASLMDLSMPVADMSRLPDLTALADLSSSPDLATPYPAGPYGSNVGNVIANMAWEGYVNPMANGLANKQPYGALSLNDVRLSGNKFALLYAADYF